MAAGRVKHADIPHGFFLTCVIGCLTFVDEISELSTDNCYILEKCKMFGNIECKRKRPGERDRDKGPVWIDTIASSICL